MLSFVDVEIEILKCGAYEIQRSCSSQIAKCSSKENGVYDNVSSVPEEPVYAKIDTPT